MTVNNANFHWLLEDSMSKIKVNHGQFLFLLIDQLESNQSKDIFQSNFKHFDQKTFLEDTQGLN